MTSTVTPSEQIISIDPVTGKLFDFDTSSSRYYFSRTMNNLLRVFGTDVIIDGLNITNLNYNKTTNIISLTITSGKLVIDTTLLEFPTSNNLDIAVGVGNNSIAHILVFANYRFSETLYENKCKFKLVYMTADHIVNPIIEANSDRVLLQVLNYDTSLAKVTINTELTSLVLSGKTYEVRPLPNIQKSLQDYIRLILK
jgi:hypothetical protein